MALEGTLDDFSLPEILHLLEYGSKTGDLAVSDSGRVAVLRVAAGRLAAADPDDTRFGLARRLVGSGEVDDADLAAAAEVGRDEAGLLDALASRGAVGAEQLGAARREHTLDAVFDVMRQPAGAFLFTASERIAAGLDLPVDDVVAEVRQRLSAYDGDRGLLPPAESTVGLAPTLADDAVLHPGEWALLPLLDGRRTIAELADLTGRGEYAVVRAVAGLMHRGLAVAGPGRPGAADLARRAEVLRRLESGSPPALPPPPIPPPAIPLPAEPPPAEPLPAIPLPAEPHATGPDPAALRLIRAGVLAR